MVEAYQDIIVKELIFKRTIHFFNLNPQDHPSHLIHFHHSIHFSIITIIFTFLPLFFMLLATKNFIFQYFLFPYTYSRLVIIYQDRNYLHYYCLMDCKMDQNDYHYLHDLSSFTQVSCDLHC
jgi:hypothetical protein